MKQEPPAEIEQNLSEPSPSISHVENENPENVKIKVEVDPRDEHQYKESIEVKDELALDLENSNLTWS